MSNSTSAQDLLREIFQVLAASATEDDYRKRAKLLKRASFLMGYLEPLSDVTQLDSLIDGLNQAANVHSFPEEIRKLRTKFLKRRAQLVGGKSIVLAKVTGKLELGSSASMSNGSSPFVGHSDVHVGRTCATNVRCTPPSARCSVVEA